MERVDLKSSGRMTAQEADQMLRMLTTFKQSEGYQWLMLRLADSLAAVNKALDTTAGVGEGAWKLAQAQGQKVSLKQAMTITDGTILALDAYLRGEAPPEEEPEL